MELLLLICEHAVIEEEPLLLNCGCDSSYKSLEAWHEDEALWESGEKHPPVQPALTRTCKFVRALAIPIYYQQNVFRAHYCYETDLTMAIRWLKGIGHANRLLMRDFALWDKNPSFDAWIPRDIKQAQRSDIVRCMGGCMETVGVPGFCCHKVAFEEGEREYYDAIPWLFGGDLETRALQIG